MGLTVSAPTAPATGIAGPPRRATLKDIVGNLGRDLLEVAAAPRGLDVPVGGVVIPDAAEPDSVAPDDIVLGVGVTDDDAGRALVTAAGAADASAVIVKRPAGRAEGLSGTAAAADVALLTIASEVGWAQLHTLLRSASLGAGRSTAAGVDDAPLGDLFALANAIAALVGGPTAIKDPQSHVLAYSNLGEEIDEPRRQTILGRRVPDEWLRRLHEEGVFRQLWTSGDVIRFAGGGEVADRLALAIRVGPRILGQIWVAAGSRPLGADAETALRQVRDIAALHLVRYHTARYHDRRARGETLQALLSGDGPLVSAAVELGFGEDTRLAVWAVAVDTDDGAERALQRERVLDLLAVYWDAYRRRSAQAALGERIYVLLAVPDHEPGLGPAATDFTRRADAALSARISVGVGATVDRLTEVARSRADADRVLRVLCAQQHPAPAATIDEVRTQAALLELADVLAERPHLQAGRVDDLAAHDRDHGTAYVETLEAWLTAFGDVPAAAAVVSVHPNTFRYRLRRLRELAGIDLDAPDERLLAYVQLRLRGRGERAEGGTSARGPAAPGGDGGRFQPQK